MPSLKRLLKFASLAAAAGFAALVVVCLIPADRPVAPIQPRESTEYWRMSGGYRIAYTRVPARPTVDANGVAARPARAPIIFLHGGPGGYIYTSTIETMGRFAELGHDVYLYDQIGSGLSDRLRPKNYGVLRSVEDLREIITTHIGAERAILIAQSYGADLAVHLMALYPDLVERAVMTSPGTLDPTVFEDGRWVNLDKYPKPDELTFIGAHDFIPETFAHRMRFRTIASLALATAFNVKLMDDDEADAVLNALAAKITKGMVCDPSTVPPEEGGGGFYAHYLGNWYGDLEDPRPVLATLDTPVLVLHGQCDFFGYEAVYEFADVFPNGEYRFIEGAGHEIWWDKPDVFVDEIRRFLLRTAPG